MGIILPNFYRGAHETLTASSLLLNKSKRVFSHSWYYLKKHLPTTRAEKTAAKQVKLSQARCKPVLPRRLPHTEHKDSRLPEGHQGKGTFPVTQRSTREQTGRV